MKSLSALVAEQWITIRSIFLINLPFHSFSFSLSAKEKQHFQYNFQDFVNHSHAFLIDYLLTELDTETLEVSVGLLY